MKIGIFGGTFNPPHMGHLIVAEYAREHLGLSRVMFVPSAVSPHKQGREIIDGHHRLTMLQEAVRENSGFAVSDLEVQRGGVSYTVDTLQELHGVFPQYGLVLLIGADNLNEFHLWRAPERILELADVVALTRPGFSAGEADPGLAKHIAVCQVPAIGIEARQIRRRVREGQSIRYLVPAAVESYILRHRLYR
jgi:nicotinate-nucleotide adenylyltransferase